MAKFKNEKGMNLVEVMVTMFMVALLGCSLLGGFVGSQCMIRQAGCETRASSFAYHVLEDLRAQGWAKIETNAEKGSYTYLVDGNEDYGVDMQATVCIEENQEIPFLYDTQVVVTWKESGTSRNLEMITLLNPALRESKI